MMAASVPRRTAIESRGFPAHEARILSNDPSGIVNLFTVR
jgi:hypothetical protein